MSNGVFQCVACGGTGDNDTPCDCPPADLFDWQTLMPHCATCKHWDQTSQLRDLAFWEKMRERDDWMHRSRERDLEDAEYGDCAMLHESDGLKNQTHVDQWWRTPQQTHREFGCILWENKED